MSEFAPPGSNARMTAAQVRKYTKDMKKAQKEAKIKLEEAQNSGEIQQEAKYISNLEDIIDDLDNVA